MKKLIKFIPNETVIYFVHVTKQAVVAVMVKSVELITKNTRTFNIIKFKDFSNYSISDENLAHYLELDIEDINRESMVGFEMFSQSHNRFMPFFKKEDAYKHLVEKVIPYYIELTQTRAETIQKDFQKCVDQVGKMEQVKLQAQEELLKIQKENK